METLKKRKSKLIKWMKQGNTIEQCSQPGYALGRWSYTPIEGLQPVINTLLSQGCLTFETFYIFGIRWERFKLNENTINSEGK